MKDRRTEKTKRAIVKTFLELLEQKPHSRITVAEISRGADLGRGTFYLHYRDVYDLFAQLENELMNDLEALYDSSYPCYKMENLLKLSDDITEYMENNRELFIRLYYNGQEGGGLQKVKRFFVEKMVNENSGENSTYSRTEAIFLVAGIMGVLESWIDEGMEEPRHLVAKSLYEVLGRMDFGR